MINFKKFPVVCNFFPESIIASKHSVRRSIRRRNPRNIPICLLSSLDVAGVKVAKLLT